MVGTAALKEFLRSITRKPGRFLALAAIVALGAGFYAGLRMTAPDMEHSLDAYLDSTRASDLRVVSSLGLTEADLSALADVPGVEAVSGAYACDGRIRLNDAAYTVRFHSLPQSQDEADPSADESPFGPDDQNQLTLAEGRWPAAAGECIICADCILDAPYGVGDAFTVDADEGSAAQSLIPGEYTVVGLVRSPLYVSQVSLGTTSLGSGALDQYVYVLPSDFQDRSLYSEAFIAVEGAQDEVNDTPAYDDAVQAVSEGIDVIASEREEARLAELRRQAEEAAEAQLAADGLPPAYIQQALQAPEMRARIDAELPQECTWLVLDRQKNVGIHSFLSDAERVDSIASVFPFVFFLVAALVALTTMTRMVDEERLLIGTYKALGYGRARIAAKYLGYGLLASGVGAVVGIAVLSQVLPAVIMNAYGIMYRVPPAGFPLDVSLAALAFGLSVGVVLIATEAAVATTLRARPAALLRPAAPRSGKRILLERIRPLWGRLSFSWKVTCRNIFRYKKRFIMTLIGIAGCTALLLTGLGLHNAVNDIIDIHFTDIIHYNTIVTLDEDAPEEDRREAADLLDSREVLAGSQWVCAQTFLAQGEGDEEVRVELVVPEDPEGFPESVTLRNREDHSPLPLEDDAVIISEKLGRDLSVGPGDTIRLYDQDALGNATGEGFEFTVGGLAESYVNSCVFASPEAYERAFGTSARFDRVYGQLDPSGPPREEVSERLDGLAAVSMVAFNDETIETYRTMLRSVDLIVAVLVICAALLAFIVLYNLTNINIEERIREIATLKVLGFTRREVNAYVFREVILLALVGCALGLVLGIPLEGFVVSTAEVDAVMFGRTIHGLSFLAAFLLTMAFTLASLALMIPKLARINMVESLKSNE